MIDLREQDRQAITAMANNAFASGTELWAYGSRVKGTNHAASDLDLVVKTPDGIDFDLEQLVTFKDALQQSNIPLLVQAMSWQHIPAGFQNIILQNYEVLCVAKNNAGKPNE